jgi:hypothetical protein
MTEPQAPAQRTHRTDFVSLVFGVFFLAVVGLWAGGTYLNWALTWQLPHVEWFLAGALIVFGLLGIGASLRRGRERQDKEIR